MKKIIYTVILLFAVSVDYSFSQCDNNVSTDPNNPSNSSLPDDSTSSIPYTMDNRFLNGLDWWSPSSYTLTDMEFNPGQPYGTMTNIQTINQQQYYTYLKHNPLDSMSADQMNPENGWELLLVNLGRYPDNINVHGDDELNVVPYLVFYHRYTGVIRVFVRYGNNTFPPLAINGVKINLYYNTDGNQNNLSGLFRLGDGLDRALDQSTVVSQLSAIAPPNGQANFWLSADFQTAYDPCVCHYPTNIELDFEYFSTTSLKLYGRGISTQEDLINSSGNIINNDFLSGVDFSSQMNAENGFVIYKNMTHLVDDYYDRLLDYETSLSTVQQGNDKVERNLAIIKVGKIVLSSGIAAVTGTTELTSLITLLPNINAWDSIGQKTFWKELDKVLFEGLDLLVKENFTKQSVPQAPSTPTASFSEMYFEGELMNILPINGPQFHTPGSFLNNNDSIFNATNSVFSYPVYNNPLGVFALLEQPKIEISNSLIMPESCANSIITLGNYANVTQTYSHYRNVQFKLKNPLKYAFNSTLDIENYSIEGSVIIEFETVSGNSQVDSSEYLSGYFINANSHNYPGVYANDKKGVFQVNSVPIPLDGILDFTSQFTSQHTRKKYFTIHTSQLDELSTICDDNIDEINHSDYTRPNVKKAFLRLSVDVEYNDQKSNGDPHQYNYIFTYEIDLDGDVHYSSSPIVQNLILSPINLSQYEYDLELNGINFNGQNINGCALENNLYLCKAENNVTLQGAFTVAPGYEVIVQATNEINVLPEASLPPEMILQIAPFIDLNSPMPQVDLTFINAFCEDTTAYRARKSLFAPLVSIEETTPSSPEEQSNFSFNLYPNPTGGQTTVALTLDEQSVVDLVVTDISGKILLSGLSNAQVGFGRSEYQLATETLATGIYLVHLSVNGERHVKRLIKN